MFQPELFQDLPEQKPKPFQLSNFPGRFLRLRVAYEDAVFAALGLILVVLAGFCLGVERGKRVGPQPQPVGMIGIATARESVPASQPVPPTAGRRKLPPVIPAAVPAAPSTQRPKTEEFAIQLATYGGQSAADEEARRLAQRGVRVQVIRQGRLLELRAAGYRSKPEAKTALGTLRKSYPDAFLKRVSANSNN